MIGNIAALTLGKWVVTWKLLVILSAPSASGLVFNKYEIEPNEGFPTEAKCEEFVEELIEKSKDYPEKVAYWVCIGYKKYTEEEFIYY